MYGSEKLKIIDINIFVFLYVNKIYIGAERSGCLSTKCENRYKCSCKINIS